MQATIDHLVVTAPTLDAGVAHVAACLGVDLDPGGQHPVMGTHNRLLSLGPGCYLEVIAPDPSLPAPARPRWFRMDEREGTPRLTNWVLRTGDLDTALSVAPDGAGQATALTRGDLAWRIGIPADGRLPFDDLFPALIEWQGIRHPSLALPDRGCRLTGLDLTHPDTAAIDRALAPFRPLPDIRVIPGDAPRLTARIETPAGMFTLG
jgi:hypothetical protein